MSNALHINSRAVRSDMLAPWTVTVMQNAASLSEPDSFHILSEDIEELSKTFFATSAGPDLVFLSTVCKAHSVDIIEVKIVEPKNLCHEKQTP